ncbi:hypothetical protein MTR67_051525 [Solanum verrucosum]|uniref:Uncharacterized protein n=1 Tax=Solanum verrucosum TaxID=315347 RepID=A0AAF0V5A8_SOLVR|nr:hypothetical protein MTR67_051525 [Solanum verrucosum]
MGMKINTDHLSRLEEEELLKLADEVEIDDTFPDEQVLADSYDLIPWFTDFANNIVSDVIPLGLSFHQCRKFMSNVKKFFWEESYLFRVCANGIIRCCNFYVEMMSILEACHSSPVDGTMPRGGGKSMTPSKRVGIPIKSWLHDSLSEEEQYGSEVYCNLDIDLLTKPRTQTRSMQIIMVSESLAVYLPITPSFSPVECGEKALGDDSPELVHEAMEKVQLISKGLKTAQSRQKAYVDVRRRDLEFDVEDWVYLKISPMKGVISIGMTLFEALYGKRFRSPMSWFEVGEVALIGLELVHEVMEKISPMKGVMRFGKKGKLSSCYVDNIGIKESISYENVSVEILDWQVQKLMNKEVASVKVLWRNQMVDGANWEVEADMMS